MPKTYTLVGSDLEGTLDFDKQIQREEPEVISTKRTIVTYNQLKAKSDSLATQKAAVDAELAQMKTDLNLQG